jgi:hypothetical protein
MRFVPTCRPDASANKLQSKGCHKSYPLLDLPGPSKAPINVGTVVNTYTAPAPARAGTSAWCQTPFQRGPNVLGPFGNKTAAVMTEQLSWPMCEHWRCTDQCAVHNYINHRQIKGPSCIECAAHTLPTLNRVAQVLVMSWPEECSGIHLRRSTERVEWHHGQDVSLLPKP